MKILVTGGAGFIGSHIVDQYIKEGHEVVIVDNLLTGKKENLNSNARFFNMDIQDKKLEGIFEKEKFDIVNHHAAQIDVRKSVKNPIFDAQINIIGILNILNNCVSYNVKKIIFASSGGVMYGECDKGAPSEEFPAKPLSPYGITKRTAELYLYYYYLYYSSFCLHR